MNKQLDYNSPLDSAAEKIYIARKVGQLIGKDYAGYLFWFLAVLFWVLGFIYINDNNIGPNTSVLIRGSTKFFYNLIWVLLSKQTAELPNRNLLQYNFRYFIFFIYGFAIAEAQFYLPLTIVQTIYCSAPLFIFIVDYFVNKIPITSKQLFGLFIAFSGVLLTINGDYLLNGDSKFQTKFKYYKTQNPIIKIFVGFSLCLFLFPVSYATIVIKKFPQLAHSRCNLHFGAWLVGAAGLLYPFAPTSNYQSSQNVNDNITIWKCILFHGIPVTVSQSCYIFALRLSKKTGVMSCIGFISIIITYFISASRYNEAINLICVFGSVTMLVGLYMILFKF